MVSINKRKKLQFTIKNRKIIAVIEEFNGRLFVNSLHQIVKRPRAYCEVSRKIWPTMNPNKIARASLDQLTATRNGLIQDDTAITRIVTGN